MRDNRFQKLVTRRSSKFAATLAFLGVALVATTQAIGAASAETRANAGYGSCIHNVPKACLWVHAWDSGTPGSKLMLSIFADDSGVADLETPTAEGHGIVHAMPEQFVDNISNGVNRLPYTLCLIDSYTGGGLQGSSEWSSRTIMPVPPNGKFTQLDDYNDIWDTYTTTSKACPSFVRFRTNDHHVTEKR